MIIVTGAAGFIGYSVAKALLARGEAVVGIDNLNDYYDVSLKKARLAQLAALPGFIFRRMDIADPGAMLALAGEFPGVTHIVHLAAQAGVRYSLQNPYAYVSSNVMGQVVMLELARKFSALRHMVYASSSSVYGGNVKLPFSESDPVETPVSLYAATKRADELIGHTYTHLYGLKLTGLRFFTVYGPWGRPDMAPMLFASAITAGKPIRVFNGGNMWRDFTFIDDVVAGVLAALDRPPPGAMQRIYNLGNNRSERLLDFIACLETALGKKAEMRFEPMQPGDVEKTYADIASAAADFGYCPATPIDAGIPKFVAWFRQYYNVGA